MTEIGRLTDVNPRDAWQHEAHDFTPWLSSNLNRLGDVIGIQLEAEGVEVAVDEFSADILARDLYGDLVLIENQLAGSDHTHLGQIMTYLSGLDAKIVIWVATSFRDSHLSAINWLNEHTEDSFSFFAVQLRVVRIADSPPAPIFDVVVRPNEWERKMQRAVRQKSGEATALGSKRREFWQYYLERYPDDTAVGVHVDSSPSKWLSPAEPFGLFVAIYLAKEGVGVFLRGPRGMTPAEVQQHVAPHAQRFDEFVGGCKYLGDERNHPGDNKKIDTDDRANWDAAVDWLHDRGHAFLAAATQLFGKQD